MSKERSDNALVSRGLVQSRSKAQALIMAGQVYIGEKKVLKSSETIEETEDLNIRGEQGGMVSRGSHKLEKAVAEFKVDVCDKTALDIGASTGGFTDVLLRHGARHVYAIDVGYGQLDWCIRNDSRVTVMERTNARLLTLDNFTLHPNLTVMDVSFISIKLILPVAALIMGGDGRFLTLIKPQFEAGKGQVGKNGIVCDPQVHLRVLREICEFVPCFGWHVQQLTFSPIKGAKGNIEFFADIQPGLDFHIEEKGIWSVVNEAHVELDRMSV